MEGSMEAYKKMRMRDIQPGSKLITRHMLYKVKSKEEDLIDLKDIIVLNRYLIYEQVEIRKE